MNSSPPHARHSRQSEVSVAGPSYGAPCRRSRGIAADTSRSASDRNILARSRGIDSVIFDVPLLEMAADFAHANAARIYGIDVSAIWIEQTEGAKFWLRVMNELKNRGIGDILIAIVDGLKGFPEAINAVFPPTVIQTWLSQWRGANTQRRRRYRPTKPISTR